MTVLPIGCVAELRSGLVMTTHILTPLIGEFRSGARCETPSYPWLTGLSEALGMRELSVLAGIALLTFCGLACES